MNQTDQKSTFREDVRRWIKNNFPSSLVGKNPAEVGYAPELKSDHDLWRQELADKGWGAPTWPRQYGGGDLGQPENSHS